MYFEISPFAGVDAGAPIPSVFAPVNDWNLIAHDFGRGALPASLSGVTLLDITDDLKSGIGVAQQSLAKLVKKLDVARATALLTAAGGMGLVGKKRLVAIHAQKPDNVFFKSGAKSLSILVRAPRTVTLAMLYYRYTGSERQDAWKAMGGALDSKSHSRAEVEAVNKFFLPQSNISFDLQSVKDWDNPAWIDATKGPPANIPNMGNKGGESVARDLFEKRVIDKKTDITVIVVPRLKDADAIHINADEKIPNVVYVPWKFDGVPATDSKADLFVPEMCHELVHGLGKVGHSNRAGVMCNLHDHSTLDQELLIDKDTLDQIYPLPH